MDKQIKKGKILIVDDERSVRESFRIMLKDDYEILLADSGKSAKKIIHGYEVDLVILDIRLPDISGIDLLKEIKSINPDIEVIMVTAVNEVQSAVKCIKLGAYEYIVKPFIVEDMLNIISRAIERRNLVQKVSYLEEKLKKQEAEQFDQIIGEDLKMKEIFNYVSVISRSDGPVLIQGESGTGKELIAKAIHRQGSRKDKPFVIINCATIPPTLLESELFGYEKGAFTDAKRSVKGKLEIANKGTVFLDDIDCLSINMQAKLLRVLQEKEIQRIGSNKTIKLDVRFIASTNKELEELINKGLFREDLYYRLNMFPIRMPPLRERKGDIPLLVNSFLHRYASRNGEKVKDISKHAMEYLINYDWPGNVRELENFIERLCTIIDGPVIHVRDLISSGIGLTNRRNMNLKEAIDAFERRYIKDVLDSVNWNKKRAASILGIHRNTLLNKMNYHGIK